MTELVERWSDFLNGNVSRHQKLVQGVRNYVERLERNDLPVVFEFPDLSDVLGVPSHVLASIVNQPENYYHYFELKKRSGGVREISVPSPILRQCQKWILDEILSKVPIHECAHGFAVGRSILTNANNHLTARCVLKMDIKDFFPSISLRRGVAIFLRCGYPRNVSYYLSSLCFLMDGLPQGAPTSPSISNIIAKRLDARLLGLAKANGLVYTRYADDLAFSGDEIGLGVPRYCEEIIRSEGFLVNNSKTRLIRGPGKKIVAGISVSGRKPRLPRASVRKIKSDIFNLWRHGYWLQMEKLGYFDPIYVERLRGRVAFWKTVDPEHRSIGRLETMLDEAEERLQKEIADGGDFSLP